MASEPGLTNKTRSFNLKVSGGIRTYREYSLKRNKVKTMKMTLGIRVGISLERKICYFCVFVMYKRESPSSKFPECKQMINEAWVFSNCLFTFFKFLYLPKEKISSG